MKKLYLNLMLVIMMISVGMNAWGQEEKFEILYGLPTYASDGVTVAGVEAQGDFTDDYATTMDFTDGNGNTSLNFGGSVLATTTAANWTKDFSTPITTGKVYFSGTYSIAANTNQRIRIVDSNGNVIFGTAQNNTGNNATQIVAYVCGTEISNYVRQPRKSGYGVKEICIDLDAKTVTYDLIVSSGNGTTNELTGTVDFPYSNVKGLFFAKASADSYRTFLDNVKFYAYEKVGDLPYVINYTYESSILKSTTGTNSVGAIITADQTVVVDGVKYIVAADEAPSMTITEGTNELNVPVRLPYTATLNVTTTVNGESSINTTNLTESDYHDVSWSYAYPLYKMSSDGLYYKADNITTFGEGGTFVDGEVINKTVTYTNADADVVFFSDASNTVGKNYSYSNGEFGHVDAQNARDRGIAVGTLPAGSYEFEVNLTAANRRSLVIRQGTNDPLALVGTSNEDMTTGIKTAQFVLTEETGSLFINGANSGEVKTNQSEDFDYVLIRKATSTVPCTIGSTGYTTFCSEYPLDLAAMPKSVSAFYVKADGVAEDAVTLTQIATTVPAGTGLILSAPSAGTYNIPVAASAEALEGNLLVGVLTAETVSKEEGYIKYVLAKSGEKAVFQYIDEIPANVPAGKAYIKMEESTSGPGAAGDGDAPTVNPAKMLNIYLPGEATAIKTVKTAEQFDGAIYNLAGQRVGADYKGIVIMNGKKYLVK